ncbi:hypothetical protein F4805DRAFT_434950 [Annulohypoxylon moriforme]|nr:hypothetical protein F4805DRAFT_434950 [Annulohypoxylon moriforme]
MFYRLSQIFPDMEFKQQSLLDWAEAYLELGARRTKKVPYPTNCGITNETLAHLSLSAVMKQNMNLVRRICSVDGDVNDELLYGSDEWMYGRAGYLYFLRLCKTLVDKTENPESNTAKLLQTTIQRTVTRILCTPWPHIWHDKEYHGAAHGTIGMITQLVLSSPHISIVLHLMLERLLEQQFSSGNFPPTVNSRMDHLVQFCHGAPGFNIALRSLLPHFRGEDIKRRIETAMENAEEDVWTRGLLTKKPCLCHGIPSNALALKEGNEERFLHFLSWMSTEEMEKRGWLAEERRDDKDAGLYTGEAGRAWVWGVAASGGPRVLIGFNDL